MPRPNWRFSALLAADVLLVFIVLPLVSEHKMSQTAAQLLALLITAGTIALVSHRRAVWLGLLASLLLAAASHALPTQFSRSTTSGLAAAYAILVILFVGRAVFARGVVDAHRIAGAVAVYLNVGVAFAAIYTLVSILSPEAFSGLARQHPDRLDEMIHFSLTTLTTVGYGDILPRSPLARSIADLEALIGQLFPATLLARLVGLQISRS